MNRAAALLFCAGLAACGGGAEPAAKTPAIPPAPTDVEAAVATFNDPQKPHAERVGALHTLRRQGGRGAFERVKDRVWIEASLADGLSFSKLEEASFVEAIGWLADLKDPRARLKLELHLDRETVKRKRLPDAVLAEAALDLANYPESESARETLWATFKDPGEKPLVRSSAMKALQAHHPKDLEERILKVDAAPGDAWLRDLQKKLK
jgi:hypothetical protein